MRNLTRSTPTGHGPHSLLNGARMLSYYSSKSLQFWEEVEARWQRLNWTGKYDIPGSGSGTGSGSGLS